MRFRCSRIYIESHFHLHRANAKVKVEICERSRFQVSKQEGSVGEEVCQNSAFSRQVKGGLQEMLAGSVCAALRQRSQYRFEEVSCYH